MSINQANGNLAHYPFTKETSVLGVGNHNIYKRLRVDEEELDKHIADYRKKTNDSKIFRGIIVISIHHNLHQTHRFIATVNLPVQNVTQLLGTEATYVIKELKAAFGNTSFSTATITGGVSLDVSGLNVPGLTTIYWTESNEDFSGAAAIESNSVKQHVQVFYTAWQAFKERM